MGPSRFVALATVAVGLYIYAHPDQLAANWRKEGLAGLVALALFGAYLYWLLVPRNKAGADSATQRSAFALGQKLKRIRTRKGVL